MLYQTDAELGSVEQVNCVPCGFTTPPANLVTDDVDAFDIGRMSRLRAEFRAMSNLSIAASAQYNLAVPTGVIRNQDSGDDLLAGMRTHTGIENTDELAVSLYMNFYF